MDKKKNQELLSWILAELEAENKISVHMTYEELAEIIMKYLD